MARISRRDFARLRREGEPFGGANALAAGLLTRHELRTGHSPILPGVYVADGTEVSARQWIRAVSLWAPSGSVIGGMAAAQLFGERWVSGAAARSQVDVYSPVRLRTRAGVRLRFDRLPEAAIRVHPESGIRVTSVVRTALDLARWTESGSTP